MRHDVSIRPEAVAAARAFLQASNPYEFDRLSVKAPRPRYNIVFDENISRHAAKILPQNIYTTTTIFDAGLCGEKDPQVWRWAVKQQFRRHSHL